LGKGTHYGKGRGTKVTDGKRLSGEAVVVRHVQKRGGGDKGSAKGSPTGVEKKKKKKKKKGVAPVLRISGSAKTTRGERATIHYKGEGRPSVGTKPGTCLPFSRTHKWKADGDESEIFLQSTLGKRKNGTLGHMCTQEKGGAAT